MAQEAATPAKSTGFVLPSNNEWVKAAYYDPKHGGTDSYWAYPTGPFKQPNVAVLNPSNGNVENASDQPLATYNPNDPNSSNDTPGAPPGKAAAGVRRKPGLPAAKSSRPISRRREPTSRRPTWRT